MPRWLIITIVVLAVGLALAPLDTGHALSHFVQGLTTFVKSLGLH